MENCKITTLFMLLACHFSLAQGSQKENVFAEKEVFTSGFPRTLSFRNDFRSLKDDYTDWEENHKVYNGITKKYLREEVNIPKISAQWANKYARKYPEKLMLLHLNGEGRSVNDEETFKLYFPGHWVYEAGSYPKQLISRKHNKIALENASSFSKLAYTVHGKNAQQKKLPHDVLIIALDDEGNRLWDKYEYVTIQEVDYQKNEITVKRGQYETKAQNFEKGNTYVAPVAGDFWGGNLMWYYNFSSTCPLGDNGNSAADLFVSEIAYWFGDQGPLADLDGIGFDVNYFIPKQKSWDCNNDGKADAGFVDGKNLWMEGDLKLLKGIRETMGEDFIITADGWKDDMQRAVGILNGMETEGLCRWNDGFRQISRTINQHTYWNLHNTTKHKFSYITSKLRNPMDIKIAPQLRRMGLGLASCLGVSYAPGSGLEIPEMLGGQLEQANWLGLPTGPMKYYLKEREDILQGQGITFDTEFLEQFDFTELEYKAESHQLTINGTKKNRRADMVVGGPSLRVESGDIMVFLEVKATDGFIDLEQESLIPRKFNIKLEGMPDISEEPMNTEELYNELGGFMGTKDFTPQMFYFRNVGGADLRLIFEAEEQGRFAIRNLKVYNAPCIISRDYENGSILVNPSFKEATVNLNAIFEEKRAYQRIIQDSEKSASEDGLLENPKIIRDNTQVVVPSLDALFLIKK